MAYFDAISYELMYILVVDDGPNIDGSLRLNRFRDIRFRDICT